MIRRTADASVVVDVDYYWQPIETCPIGAKVQLLTDTGVAVYGTLTPKSRGFEGWAPLPKRRPKGGSE